MKDIVKEWNPLDTLLYKLDIGLAKTKEIFFPEEPDVESIIEIETDYLKKENEQLRELAYPKQVTGCSGSYFCPNKKCRTEIAGVLVEQYRIKHCPECGQRIFLNRYHKVSSP